MNHLKILHLLTALSNSKKIMNDLKEFDDYDIIELLEIKYEKLYKELYKF